MDTEFSITAMLAEMDWLQQVIEQVVKTYLLPNGHENNWQDIPLNRWTKCQMGLPPNNIFKTG